jgi:DNA-binding LytR/AlgR family response regulator
MLKIAICDDEKYFREELKGILSKYLDKNGIGYSIDLFDSGKEFSLLGIEMLKYDIVFLDINMDQMDGIETARMIRSQSNDIFIVFVTAFIDYTIEGYKVDAVRYILKNNNTLAPAIEECMDAIREKMSYEVAMKEFEFCEGLRSVSLEHILYIESNLHKLTFYIMEESIKQYTIYKTLDELEKDLSDAGFLRVHQSFLVNIKHISKAVRYSLTMDNGVEIGIAKARFKDVQKAVVEYKGVI